MKLYSVRIGAIALITLFLFLILCTVATAQVPFEVESMTIKVYRDGLTHVTQTLIVDELLPEIDLLLLSLAVENLIILDENQLAVDYQLNAENLTVFTLGASRASVEYDTTALTKKEAEVWTLILNNPYNLTVFLPQNSTVIYLNQMPTTIDTTGNELSLSLYPGQWELSYIVPLLPEDQDGDVPLAAFPLEYLVATAIAVSATFTMAIWLVMRKRKINAKRILKLHPELIKEDRAVIEFLAEKEGKAFEAEIRERFPDMPRTSLWRLVRRLERLEIVEVKKVGLENQVQLKK
jgi:uncharacterized membrane protein